MTTIEQLHAGRFQALPGFCGQTEDAGVDETEEWRDWTQLETTPDQMRIEDYLLAKPLSDKSILHIGIGNSSLAKKLSSRCASISGTTISNNEVIHGNGLHIDNYHAFIHNKYSGNIPEYSKSFDIIVDNNISTFCCCLQHMYNLMKFYSSVLAPHGAVITDRAGLNWVTSMPGANPRWKFDFDDLEAIGSLAGLTAYKATDDIYMLARERPVAYIGGAPKGLRKWAGSVKQILSKSW